jgi:hypothetical protein
MHAAQPRWKEVFRRGIVDGLKDAAGMLDPVHRGDGSQFASAGLDRAGTRVNWGSGIVDDGEEVVEGLVGACGVAGRVEVHEEAADDGEHDGGQLWAAEAAHPILEGCEPVGRGGPPEAGPQWFSRAVVQPGEYAEVGLALWPGDRRPCAGQSHGVGLAGSEADEVGEGLDLTTPGLSEDLAEQRVTGPEVVDQHPVRGARGDRQRLEPIGEAVIERVVGARVEEPLPDLRLSVPAHRRHFFT